MKTLVIWCVLAVSPVAAWSAPLSDLQPIEADWDQTAVLAASLEQDLFAAASVGDRAGEESVAPVTTLAQLKSRLAQAKAGAVIRIAINAVFDMTDEQPLLVDKPVSIVGNTAYGDPARPLFLHRGKLLPVIIISSPGVKLAGLKIEGTETDSKKKEIIELNNQGISGVYQFPITRGIEVNSSDVSILNCELLGFSHAAISLNGAKNAVVAFNTIHHNQRWGLGYGVVLSGNATALVQWNRFDFNRHSIAGTGHPGQAYEASHNLFGKDHIDTPLDMHGGKDRKDNTQIAGRKVDMHDNTILTTGVRAFIHRGIAEEVVLFHHNTLYYPDQKQAIGYYNGVTEKNLPENKFKFYGNIFRKF